MLNKAIHHVTLSQKHMATTFALTLAVPKSQERRAEACLLEAHDRIAQLESLMSEYKSESDIYKLNSARPGTPVELSRDVYDILKISDHLEKETKGAFSITAKCGSPFCDAVSYANDGKSAKRLTADARLSLGAIGKGYALDQLRSLIESWGFSDYLLSAGGSSIIATGYASPSEPWSIGWSNDGKVPFRSLKHYKGFPIALGISGTSEQGFHIIDPRTASAVSKTSTSFVSHPSATYADALSTALFVLGWKDGLTLFHSLIEKPSLALITDDNEVFWNGTFQELWGPMQ